MPQQCRPSEGRPPFDDVPTIQIFPGKLAFITSGQRISFQRCQPTIPPRIVQAGLAGWLAGTHPDPHRTTPVVVRSGAAPRPPHFCGVPGPFSKLSRAS